MEKICKIFKLNRYKKSLSLFCIDRKGKCFLFSKFFPYYTVFDLDFLNFNLLMISTLSKSINNIAPATP